MIDKESFYLNLGKIIKNKREESKLTIDGLKELSGLDIGKSSISEIENGKQKILPHQLYLVCQALNVSIDSLIKESMMELGEKDQEEINQL